MAQEGVYITTTSFMQLSNGHHPEKSGLNESNGLTRGAAETQDNIIAIAKPWDLTSQVLSFLSTAGNDTIGACLVGLSAITYLVLGRIGLILIGVVLGVVLHATWDQTINAHGNADEDLKDTDKRRKEQGFALLERVLDWRERRQNFSGPEGDKVLEESPSTAVSTEWDFSDFPPATGTALNYLTEAVIRDYVKWWYGPLLPTEISFPTSCRKLFTKFLLNISSHLSRKRPADAFLNFLTNSSSIVIVFLNEFSSALTTASSGNTDCARSLYKYLEANPDSNLANILDVEQQKKKLQAVAEDILQNFLDSKAYQFELSRTFLREVLAELVLESTVITCSKQEWINGWIISLLEHSDATVSDALDSQGEESISGARQGLALQSTSTNGTDVDTESDLPEFRATSNAAHKRTVSRAEYAMEEAMQEAKRLSELIAAEEARKREETVDQELAAVVIDDVGSLISQQNGRQSPKLNPEDEREKSESFPNSPKPSSSFTNFDQILNSENSIPLQTNGLGPRPTPIPPLTLYDATVSIFDDSQPGEKATMRSKPGTEYLLQIEPASSQHPGWMISRKYTDFETLHEVLRRISVVSGVPQFAKKHGVLPTWKNQTKALMRRDLELYLRDALSFSRLAESEGMKRFLEKDQGLNRASPNKPKTGFGFPSPAAFENMGKGMLDVLASAPKGAAGGGKAILGGVTGVFGGAGSKAQRKQSQTPSLKDSSTARLDTVSGELGAARESQDSVRNSVSTRTVTSPSRSSLSLLSSTDESDVTSNSATYEDETQEPLTPVEKKDAFDFRSQEANDLHLPPPPSEIPDDYKISQESLRTSESMDAYSTAPFPGSTAPTSHHSPTRQSISSLTTADSVPTSLTQPKRKKALSMTENETQVAVELFFAVVNELYTLSSAWNIRRTLLNAAKGFLLRPGNPNLEAIRLLLQETVIEANTSDVGIAAHLTKLRENTLPTADELQKWPKPLTQEEKEKMRVKARKLLVEKGMPLALTSVMGAAASGEALGRVFDCLQVEEVARGLMFSLVVQAIRAVTQ